MDSRRCSEISYQWMVAWLVVCESWLDSFGGERDFNWDLPPKAWDYYLCDRRGRRGGAAAGF